MEGGSIVHMYLLPCDEPVDRPPDLQFSLSTLTAPLQAAGLFYCVQPTWLPFLPSLLTQSNNMVAIIVIAYY